MRFKELAHEEFEREDLLFDFWFFASYKSLWLVLCLGQSVALRHHGKQELEGITIDFYFGLLESLDELFLMDIAIAFTICRGKGLLQGDSFVWEHRGPDVIKDLVRPAQAGSSKELDLLLVDLLQ